VGEVRDLIRKLGVPDSKMDSLSQSIWDKIQNSIKS